MKYIVTRTEDGTEEIFTFPRSINHDAMAEALEGIRNQTHGNWERVFREPVSAGFLNEHGHCHGNSESLGLKSRTQDTEILKNQYR